MQSLPVESKRNYKTYYQIFFFFLNNYVNNAQGCNHLSEEVKVAQVGEGLFKSIRESFSGIVDDTFCRLSFGVSAVITSTLGSLSKEFCHFHYQIYLWVTRRNEGIKNDVKTTSFKSL